MSPSPRPSAPLAMIFMGVSGCGKSTLGALVAEALRCRFLEGDDYHSPEAIAKMRSGKPLDDEDRWPWIDRLGEATARAVAEHGAAVTACSALRRSHRDRLRAAIPHPVQFVLLENSRARLIERLTSRVGHFMPVSLLDSQLAALERPLADEGALNFMTEEPPARLRDRILARISNSKATTC